MTRVVILSHQLTYRIFLNHKYYQLIKTISCTACKRIIFVDLTFHQVFSVYLVRFTSIVNATHCSMPTYLFSSCHIPSLAPEVFILLILWVVTSITIMTSWVYTHITSFHRCLPQISFQLAQFPLLPSWFATSITIMTSWISTRTTSCHCGLPLLITIMPHALPKRDHHHALVSFQH